MLRPEEERGESWNVVKPGRQGQTTWNLENEDQEFGLCHRCNVKTLKGSETNMITIKKIILSLLWGLNGRNRSRKPIGKPLQFR